MHSIYNSALQRGDFQTAKHPSVSAVIVDKRTNRSSVRRNDVEQRYAAGYTLSISKRIFAHSHFQNAS
jgi:hypothetical protein